MHLTAMEIFTTACSYISQTVEDSEDIIGFAPAWLNVLLAECLETENTLRRMDGQSTYQYESYYWPGIPATCVWVENGALRFGTAGGEVREFWPGTLAGQYNDGGQPVTAYWCTPLMNLGTWSNVKTVTNVWVVGKPYSRSGGEMYFITNKDYERLGRSCRMRRRTSKTPRTGPWEPVFICRACSERVRPPMRWRKADF